MWRVGFRIQRALALYRSLRREGCRWGPLTRAEEEEEEVVEVEGAQSGASSEPSGASRGAARGR